MRSRGAVNIARRLPATILAIVVLAGCADSRTPAGGASKPAPIPAAQAKVFVPVATSVSRTVHGSCWTSSITVATATAYRCYAGNQILDPCFAASPAAQEVTCYADPWSQGVRLVLTKNLPSPAPLAVSHPWALELATGKKCVAATGVVSRIGDLPLLYQCHGGGATGLPATRDGRTHVKYLAPGAHATVDVAVAVIWQA